MLHVTNGDAAREAIEGAGLAERAIAWRDVLYEGPVPAAGDLADIRADFLARAGWADYEETRAEIELRGAALAAADEVCLWFEADLYDQLQLVQALAELPAETPAWLVQVETLAGVDPYPLYPTRSRVGDGRRDLARRTWEAFRSPDPRELERIAGRPDRELPFLPAALRRFFEEYPWSSDGLARSERQILAAVAAGARGRKAIFLAQQAMEERPFLGDVVVWRRLEELGPLLLRRGGLTALGRDVLAGRADWIEARGGIDRWLGGVHLVGDDAQWRWDGAAGALVRRL